jgi:hypothetical protein
MDILVILLIAILLFWGVGAFAFAATNLIHLLLLIAVVVLIVRLVRGPWRW